MKLFIPIVILSNNEFELEKSTLSDLAKQLLPTLSLFRLVYSLKSKPSSSSLQELSGMTISVAFSGMPVLQQSFTLGVEGDCVGMVVG